MHRRPTRLDRAVDRLPFRPSTGILTLLVAVAAGLVTGMFVAVIQAVN